MLPLISPIIDLLFLGSLLLWGLGATAHHANSRSSGPTADVQRSVVFFLGFIIIDVLTCVIAFALERHEDWTLLIPVLLQRFYYRQLMYIVLFRSVKEAVSGRPVGWRGVEHEPPRASSSCVDVALHYHRQTLNLRRKIKTPDPPCDAPGVS